MVHIFCTIFKLSINFFPDFIFYLIEDIPLSFSLKSISF